MPIIHTEALPDCDFQTFQTIDGVSNVTAFNDGLSDGYTRLCEFHITGRDTEGNVANAVFIRAISRHGSATAWVGAPLEVLSFVNGSDAAVNSAVVSWSAISSGGFVGNYFVLVRGVAGASMNWICSQYYTEIGVS